MTRKRGDIMKKITMRSLRDMLFPCGTVLLMLLFFFAAKTILRRFDFYSLSPAVEENALSAVREAQSVQTSDTDARADAPYITETRTVRETRGVLGIYDCFGNLLETCDAELSYLPSGDRALLREGVVFSSEGELRDFLESLDS